MKRFLVAMLVIPLAALAQGAGTAEGPQGNAPKAEGRRQERMQHMEKKLRLIRTVGLAEALNLEPAKALELDQILTKQDDRRKAVRKQLWEAAQVLRHAAKGENASSADVDQAIQKGLDARAQMNQLDRETLNLVLKGLTPEQRARAVLFLAHFQRRFQMEMMMHREGFRGHDMMEKHMGPGMMGPGHHEMGFQEGTSTPGDDQQMAEVPFVEGPDVDAP